MSESVSTSVDEYSLLELKIDRKLRTNYAFRLSDIKLPIGLLYDDYCCKTPTKCVDLRGWVVSYDLFEQIMEINVSSAISLRVDKCIGFTFACLQLLKNFKHITELTIGYTGIDIDTKSASIIGSFHSLKDLDISGSKVDDKALAIIGTSCKALRSMVLRHTKGLDDFCMQQLAACVKRYRRLASIDLSYSLDFSDEGALALITSGSNILKNLNFTGCKNISTLAVAALRSKMSALEVLDIASMRFGQSAFEWLAEGCHQLLYLNVCKNHEIDDAALITIGKRCHFIENLNISFCINITDIGLAGFYEHTNSRLKVLDISGCVQCGGVSAYAIGTKSEELLDLKLNGLSLVSKEGLVALWSQAKKLQKFEMMIVLKSVTTHRKSMTPHISDAILKECKYSSLRVVKLLGAFLITDIGVCSLIRKCKQLSSLDVSYCSGVTDTTLHCLATYSKTVIKELVVTGCIKITNQGLITLCSSCTNLTRLEINGCSKIADPGILGIAKYLKKLSHLSIRNCDTVTSPSIAAIGRECQLLESFEMSSLDLVPIEAVIIVAKNCPRLTSLNCETCDLTPAQYRDVVGKYLPLCQGAIGRCRLEPRARPLIEYNKYIQNIRDEMAACRVLQRFFRHIYINSFLFTNARRRREAIKTISRCLKEYRERKRIERKLMYKKIHNNVARRLQKWAKRCLGVLLNKRKVRRIRDRVEAAVVCQRVYRGHMHRKRVRYLYDRLWRYYNKIGHLVHKYVVIMQARVVHRHIVKVQSIVRMFNRKVDYTLIKRAVYTLQHRLQNWLKRRNCAERIVYNWVGQMERKTAAANTIRKLYRTMKFNTTMSSYMLVCAHWWNMETSNRWYNSMVIQKYYRGFIVRLLIKRAKELPGILYRAASRIQGLFRGCLWRGVGALGIGTLHCKPSPFAIYKRKKKFYLSKWKYFLRQKPRLRLGKKVKKIQRFYRAYWFLCHLEFFAELVNRLWRGYKARKRWHAVIYAAKIATVDRIKRYYHRYKARIWRKMRTAREHMAAWRMQQQAKTMINCNKAIKKRVFAATAARKRREALMDKKVFLLQKRQKIVEKIVKDYQNTMARRIQSRWHKYDEAMRKYLEIEENRLSLLEAVKEVVEEQRKKQSILRRILPNSEVVKATFNKIGDTIKGVMRGDDDRLIPKADTLRMKTAILRFQTKSIVQEGITELRFTQGDSEYKLFLNEQQVSKSMKKPYFECIDNFDLSGNISSKMYMWMKKGTGLDCICEMKFQVRSTSKSLVRYKERNSQLAANNVKVTWHNLWHIECLGACTIKQGNGGFAINDLKFTRTEDEGDELIDIGWKMMVDMSTLGFNNCFLWYMQRKPSNDDDIYNYGTVKVQDWFDPRLKRVMEAFNLSPSDVYIMRSNFEAIMGGAYTDYITPKAFFEYAEYPETKVCEWVVSAIKPAKKNEIIFSEYVQIVCYYVSLSRKDLIRFLFGNQDEQGKAYLKKDQFLDLVEKCVEGSGRNTKIWAVQFEDFYGKTFLKHIYTTESLYTCLLLLSTHSLTHSLTRS
jgi:hypothetical protein